MDDEFKMLGTIFILVLGIVLFFLLLMGGGPSVPTCDGPNEVPCDESPCGCCVVEGGQLDPCSACSSDEVQYVLVDGKCCDVNNIDNCLGDAQVCENPNSCASDDDCCSGFSCSDGSCEPCDTGLTCDPQDPNSCCDGLFCNSQGYCESCSNQECSVDDDCCDNFYCGDQGECLSCETTCSTDNDCCDGWSCDNGQCVKCVDECDPNTGQCPCSGYTCDNGQCIGCAPNTFCDENHPCCDGYECDLSTQRCLECENRACSSDSDCCDSYSCDVDKGICYSTSSCEGHPCTNPGEPCTVCEGDNCEQCTDNSICAYDPITKNFVCKASCPDGSVVCDAENCATGCCDPITAECAGCVEGVPCQTVDGCGCCEPSGYEVEVCPVEGYLVELSDGSSTWIECTNPALENDVTSSCPEHTFLCGKYEGACCTLQVPSDAIPDKVVEVTYDQCASGYEYKYTYCCDVSATKDGSMYVYLFDCYDSQEKGESTVSPVEKIVYGSQYAVVADCGGDPECNLKYLSNLCEEKGVDPCFVDPITVTVK